jgi:hypothetical protein
MSVLPINPDARFRVYAASEGQTVFSVPFPFQANADISVIKTTALGVETTLANPQDYTLTGAGNPAGGTLTRTVGSAVGDIIIVAGNAVQNRLAGIVRNGKFSSPAIDDDLDRALIRDQELRRDADLSVKVKFGQTPTKLPAAEAGKLLGWDALNQLANRPLESALLEEAIALVESLEPVEANIARDPALPAIHIRERFRDVFSVMEVFDNEAQREAIRAGTATFDAAEYINEATAYALSKGYGAVDLPFGTYLLDGPRLGAYQAVLLARSNLTLQGRGRGTVLKVADNYTDGGDYRLITRMDGAGLIENFALRDLLIDCNGAQNLVAGTWAASRAVLPGQRLKTAATKVLKYTTAGTTGGAAPTPANIGDTGTDGTAQFVYVQLEAGALTRRAYVLSLIEETGCKGIDVLGCFVKDHPGRNVFTFNSLPGDPILCQDVKIIGCRLKNVGGALAGNWYQNDHSCFYTHVDGCEIKDNVLLNEDLTFDPFGPAPIPARTCAAIEQHGTNHTITGNRVHNFSVGINLVAAEADTANNIAAHNTLTRMLASPITLWTFAGHTNKNLKILYNSIELGAGIANPGTTAIFQSNEATQTSRPIEDLQIIGNEIHGAFATSVAATGNGITLTGVKSARIAGNTFRNIQGCGINIERSDAFIDVDDVAIVDNRFVDCGIGTLSRIHAIRMSNIATPLWTLSENITLASLPRVNRAHNGNYYTLANKSGAGACANAPTHTFGSKLGADGYTWTWFGRAERKFGRITIDRNDFDKTLLVPIDWAAGQTYFSNQGRPVVRRVLVTGSTYNYYRLASPGLDGNGDQVVTAQAPTHTSGIVTGIDGYAWEFLFVHNGTSPRQPRGILIEGGGFMHDISVGEKNRWGHIAHSQRVTVTTTTLNKNVHTRGARIAAPRAADPAFGVWNIGDIVEHSDPIASNFAGRIVVTAGGGSSALWGTATNYTRGDWVRTSTNKVLECLGALDGSPQGQSHAATEPNPAAIGDLVVDNTVLWECRATALAVFKTYAATSA